MFAAFIVFTVTVLLMSMVFVALKVVSRVNMVVCVVPIVPTAL